jgi:glycolate oxidase
LAPEFATNEQIVLAARRNLTQGEWDYLVGGSESETTMRRNRAAYDRIAFRPRILVDVSKLDISTTFLGRHLRMPVLLAPIGSLQVFTPDAAVATAQAAHEFGVLPVISSVTEPRLEDTAAATDGAKVFQLYVRGDDAWVKDIVGRVKQAGYIALCLTVDLAVDSRRERPMVSNWVRPTRRTYFDPVYQAQLTWDGLDWIKELAGLPLILKGVATPEDAALAVEHGVNVIWVSNHGGRQLDHGRGTLDMLPEIVDAVGGKADIVVDGGVQRGSDVVKALALGAKAVAIGKLQAWGLAAGGKDGLVRVLEILESEILATMGLLGAPTVADLSPRFLLPAEPVTPPHEMSSWVNLPGDRLR